MIVVDVETTGTEATAHSLLSIGAVDLNKPDRQFSGECRAWEGAHVSDEALAVNGFNLEQVWDKSKKSEGDLVKEFLDWATASEDHTIAGMNPSFDNDFIKWACIRNKINFPLAHRTVDMHSVCYVHMIKNGDIPPLAKNRSNIN